MVRIHVFPLRYELIVICRGIGKTVTPAENRQYREELRVFRHWFDENIMSHDDSSLSDAIMIMPYGSANPKYRDTPNEYGCQIPAETPDVDSGAIKLISIDLHQHSIHSERSSYLLFCRCRSSSCLVR